MSLNVYEMCYEELEELLTKLRTEKETILLEFVQNNPEKTQYYKSETLEKNKEVYNRDKADCEKFYSEREQEILDAMKTSFTADGLPAFKEALGMFETVETLKDGSSIVQAKNGSKYLVRKARSKDESVRIKNESIVNAVYSLHGVNVPCSKIFDENGASVFVRQYVDGKMLDKWHEEASPESREKLRKQLEKGRAVDILFGNMLKQEDVIVDKNGVPWRVNNGRSFKVNANGKIKSKGELDSYKFPDEAWIMTNNNARIKLKKVYDIAKYMEEKDVFDVVSDIYNVDWKQTLNILPEDERKVIEQRLEEIRQLFVRGNRYELIEDKKTFPRETMLKFLDYSYLMSKDGLREMLATQKIVGKDCFYDASQRSFLVSDDESIPSVIGSYLAKFIGKNELDFIQMCNQSQGNGSYNYESCLRKVCVLKNNGFDCRLYKDSDGFLNEIQLAGYFVGEGDCYNNFVDSIKYYKNNKKELERDGNVVLKHDAFLQLMFENAKIQGYDKSSGTMILVRTENTDILCDRNGLSLKDEVNNLKFGELTFHNRGVCESHSHIQQFCFKGFELTVVRVPISRIHGVWFMERRKYGNKHNVKNSKMMFAAQNQNEIIADTRGIPVIYVGVAKKRDGLEKAYNALNLFEDNNEELSIKKLLNGGN